MKIRSTLAKMATETADSVLWPVAGCLAGTFSASAVGFTDPAVLVPAAILSAAGGLLVGKNLPHIL